MVLWREGGGDAVTNRRDQWCLLIFSYGAKYPPGAKMTRARSASVIRTQDLT